MSKARIAKVLGWSAGALTYAQQAIAAQSVLPHTAKGWLTLALSIALGAAVHHAASTNGTA